MISIDEIKKIFLGRILLNEPMSKYTSFRVGGPADLYCKPLNKKDLISLVQYFIKINYPFLIVGRGSNLLISDSGYHGAIINLEDCLNEISKNKNFVTVESGLRMGLFVDFCIQNNLAGVEMLAGIPGTIGGAIMMNAGAYGGEISDHISEIEILRNGKIKNIKKSDANFSYRKSGFVGDVILSGKFNLPNGNISDLLLKRRELLLKRNSSQPLNLPNSGSVFKNPKGFFAGQLVEEVGLKGFRIGNAQISDKHGNFIVNLNGATASDIMGLVRTAQEKVFEKRNIKLEVEVKLIGFENIPELVF